MSNYKLEEGQGSLFVKAESERKSENSPTHNGKIMIGGKEYYLSGWRKKAGSGLAYLSLAATSVEEARSRSNANKSKVEEAVDDSPF